MTHRGDSDNTFFQMQNPLGMPVRGGGHPWEFTLTSA